VSTTEPEDLIEDILGITPASPLGQLRRRRPEALRHAEGAYRELLLPEDPGNVSHAERAALALRVALREGETALAERFCTLLERRSATAEIAAARDLSGAADQAGPRLAALLRHADLVGLHPGDCTQADIDKLSAMGLDARDIVALTQLISFVPYQIRVIAALRAMQQEIAA
jgi:CMD domain protein